MEQYVHLLIPSDADFSPAPQQVAQFIDQVMKSPGFELLSGLPWQPGLAVLWPTGKFRIATDPWTGETVTTDVPVLDRVSVTQPADISGLIESLREYTVLLSGQWSSEHRPISLFTPDGKPFEEKYLCTVTCQRYSHPERTPDNGTARFWVEFEFGKFLSPKESDGSNVLSPSFVAMAERAFALPFRQSCRYN
jgi:hypothetical protein